MISNLLFSCEKLHQPLGDYHGHHVTVALSFFLSFFFSTGFCVGWWRCLEGGFERNECRRWLLFVSWSHFILLIPLGCDYELDSQSCSVTVCLTRHKQDQYYSLTMFIFFGGELELVLQRTAVSVYQEVGCFLKVWLT